MLMLIYLRFRRFTNLSKLLLFCLLLTSCYPATNSNGKITDTNGNPVSEATVILEITSKYGDKQYVTENSVTSDANGHFEISATASSEDNVKIKVSKKNYQSYETKIIPKKDNELNIVLKTADDK